MEVTYTVTGYIILHNTITNWMLWHKVIKSHWMKKANVHFFINISPPLKKVLINQIVSMSLSGFFIVHVCHSLHAIFSLQPRGYWWLLWAWVATGVEPGWTGAAGCLKWWFLFSWSPSEVSTLYDLGWEATGALMMTAGVHQLSWGFTYCA